MDGHDATLESEAGRILRTPNSESAVSYRDATDDNTRSPSRKRPRLDSGLRRTRSMSADRTPASAGKAVGCDDKHYSDEHSSMRIDRGGTPPPSINGSSKHARTPSRVTINVREPVKDMGSSLVDGHCESPKNQKPSVVLHSQDNDASRPTKHSNGSDASSNESSSPLIEVEAAEPDDIDGEVTEIHLIDDDDDDDDGVSVGTDMVDLCFDAFPFATSGDALKALEAVHAQMDRALDLMLLDRLSEWLLQVQKTMQDLPSEWSRVFYDHTAFWDLMTKVFSRLFNRSVFRESPNSKDYNPEKVIYRVLETFFCLLSRVLHIDTALITDELVVIQSSALLSMKFVTAARPLFREDKGLITKVLPLLDVDSHEVRRRLLRSVIKYNVPGALADMIKSILADLQQEDSFASSKIMSCVQLANQIGTQLLKYCSGTPNAVYKRMSTVAASGLSDMFRTIDCQLHKSMDKQQDILSLDLRRQLTEVLDETLLTIGSLSAQRGEELFQSTTARSEFNLEDSVYMLTRVSWRVKLMSQYIMKGRMELRLHGMDIMQRVLVDFFNAYRPQDNDVRCAEPGPMLLFIADVLCDQKLVEYLFGVTSHPQLIGRSNNAIGFLIVTNRFTRNEVELMWSTVKASQDPRIVAATFPQLSIIVKNLANFPEIVTICEVVLDSPLPNLSLEASIFLGDLLTWFRDRYQEHLMKSNFYPEKLCQAPLKVCVHLIRICSSRHPQTAHVSSLRDEAINTLALLAPLAPSTVVKDLVKTCLDIVKRSSEDGAAAAQAMYMLLKPYRPDTLDLVHELNIVSILMDDLCKFVDAKRTTNEQLTVTQINQQIWPRLDLIWLVAPNDEDRIDKELLRRFWSHLVGADAMSITARDIAWHRLAMVAFYPGSENAFLERHQELLSPTMISPEFFTSGFFSFVQKLAGSKIRRQSHPAINPKGGLSMPGLDLVWHSLLEAPAGVNEDSSIQFLIATYLDRSWLQRTSKNDVEATHVALVDECIERLKRAHASVRRSDSVLADGDDILMSDSSSSSRKAELVFLRTIKFLLRCLLYIRTRPEHRPKSVDYAPSSEEALYPIRGSQVKIRCEIMRHGMVPSTRMLSIGSMDTCRHLHRRVCSLLAEYNFASFQLINGGKRLQLLDRPRLTVEAAGLVRAPHFILREGVGSDEARKGNIIPCEYWRSAFEQQVISRLEDLCGFLDGSDTVSASAFDTLKHLPRSLLLKKLVADPSAAIDDVFPPHQPYKLSYSLECLREDIELNPEDDNLIVHGTRVLESLLSKEAAQADDPSPESHLVADSVSCLFDFVVAAKGKSLNLFVDASAVATTLTKLCLQNLDTANASSLLWDCYELLFDLCMECMLAWNTYRSNPDSTVLHKRLLFEHDDALVRQHACTLIRQHWDYYPTHSQVPLADYARFLWSLLVDAIPKAVATPQSATEILDLTNFIFSKMLEQQLLEPDDIGAQFIAWSDMAMSHFHHERIGKDEVDSVLRSLASLLRQCADAIPMHIAVTDKIHLMNAIWWNFLFHKIPVTTNELLNSGKRLPVLESSTRVELVRLLHALATENRTLEVALRNALQVPIEHKFYMLTNTTHMLRSPAGYVGMKNLGNTCYMNALVTQLFMNPIFRSFILSCAPMTKPADSPLLSETQKLFATLQNSYDKFANATDFTLKIITLTEELIDVREQMDVDEFMNTLFIRWEDQMPSAAMKERFRSIYTGKTVQQIKSKECQHVSEREDSLLAIQCDVLGKASLEESLRTFIEGDVMEGDNKYKCEPCGRLVDAVKRTCLKEVPDHVMFQLKRFTYDFDYQRRNKINDLFSFPMSIDMNQYTFEHLSNPERAIVEDIFDLVGVIVHKGQADHGHYVSYIRARPTAEGQEPEWLLFDDSDVSVFDPKAMAEACFGGLPQKETNILFQSSMKTYNAYMLFYQRRSSLQQHPWVVDDHACNVQEVPLPLSLGRDIISNNVNLVKDYCLFDESSREFTRCLLKKLETTDHTDVTHRLQGLMLNQIWSYLAIVWARTRELPEFEEAFIHLQLICSKCDRCCFLSIKWLIECALPSEDEDKSTDCFRDLILRSNLGKVRQCIRTFLLDAMKQLRHSPEFYGANVEEERPCFDGSGAISMLLRLAQFVPDSLHYNFRAWDDYFGLLADLASLGTQESWVLISEGLLPVCLEIPTLGLQVGFAESRYVERRYANVNEGLKRRLAPSYNEVIRLASVLFGYIDMQTATVPAEQGSERLKHWTEAGVPWTDYEEAILLDFNRKEGGLVWLTEVFQKWTATDTTIPLSEILRTLLNGKYAYCDGIFETFYNHIKEFEPRYANPFLAATQFLLMFLKDKEILEKLVTLMKECSRDANGVQDRSEEGYHGYYCYNFWRQLHSMAKDPARGQLNDRTFADQQLITSLPSWAPTMLMFNADVEVGRLTQRLIKDSLFECHEAFVKEGVRTAKAQDEAVRKLFWAFNRSIQMYMYSKESPWRHFTVPLYHVMSECAQFVRDREGIMAPSPEDAAVETPAKSHDILSRFDELKAWFDALPQHIEDDVELAQSSELTVDWDGVGFGDEAFDASDLTEASEDDVGAVLTGEL